MIRAVMCLNDVRVGEKKRKRLLLIIGEKQFHITRKEAKSLACDIIKRLV